MIYKKTVRPIMTKTLLKPLWYLVILVDYILCMTHLHFHVYRKKFDYYMHGVKL